MMHVMKVTSSKSIMIIESSTEKRGLFVKENLLHYAYIATLNRDESFEKLNEKYWDMFYKRISHNTR